MSVFLDLMWFFKKEKKAYLLGTFLLAFVAVLELIPPKVIGLIVDQIEKGTLTKGFLVTWLTIILAAALIVYGLRFWWRVLIFGSSIKLARLLRNQLFGHYTSMSVRFYQRKRIGDLMAHATNDIQAIQQTAGVGVLTLVDSIISGGFVLLAMAIMIDWKLTLISLLPMPIMVLATSKYGALLHTRFTKAQAAFSQLNDKVQESMNGIKVIKTFGQEEEDIHAFKQKTHDVVTKNIAVSKIDALFDPTISVIVGLSFFLAVAFGARFVLLDQLTIGELVSFTSYLGLLIWPMLAFGWLFNIVERGRASYDRVTSLLEEQVDIQDKNDALHVSPTGSIQFEISSFSYPDSKEVVLSNIFIQVDAGQTLGIVGKTGSGKTTLIKLLLREFDVTEGQIYFGKEQIKAYELSRFRAVFGYVPQDHFLFSTTIADNIAFGKPEASLRDIIKAAQLAHVADDIARFNAGYETLIGERGVTLSGGQKQRISIARALLLQPDVLILDDSLSAVDATTEEAILSSLKANRNEKTTIITSHRLSAVKHADQIIVLSGGNIIEQGSHDALIKRRGWYFETYERQQLESIVANGG